MKLIDQITAYEPFNHQEATDKELILKCLKSHEDIFSRDNKIAHITASAWVVNKNRDRILMIYHNIYDSWSWMGGHADGDRDLLYVAKKEVLEESGLTQVQAVSDNIFSLETLTVDGHEKNENYVPSHLHLNITYLLEANEEEPLIINPDETSGVAWFFLEEGFEASSEPWFRDRIYKKLNQKLKKLSSG